VVVRGAKAPHPGPGVVQPDHVTPGCTGFDYIEFDHIDLGPGHG
jgi:hypothetical protein